MMRRQFVFVTSGLLACLPRALSSDPYRVETHYRSLKFPEKKYASTEEFWSDHYDGEGDGLNKSLISLGLLLEKESRLLEDGKTMVITRTYKNRSAYTWKRSYKSKKKNSALLEQVKEAIV